MIINTNCPRRKQKKKKEIDWNDVKTANIISIQSWLFTQSNKNEAKPMPKKESNLHWFCQVNIDLVEFMK